jgi:hypothetical protein
MIDQPHDCMLVGAASAAQIEDGFIQLKKIKLSNTN